MIDADTWAVVVEASNLAFETMRREHTLLCLSHAIHANLSCMQTRQPPSSLPHGTDPTLEETDVTRLEVERLMEVAFADRLRHDAAEKNLHQANQGLDLALLAKTRHPSSGSSSSSPCGTFIIDDAVLCAVERAGDAPAKSAQEKKPPAASAGERISEPPPRPDDPASVLQGLAWEILLRHVYATAAQAQLTDFTNALRKANLTADRATEKQSAMADATRAAAVAEATEARRTRAERDGQREAHACALTSCLLLGSLALQVQSNAARRVAHETQADMRVTTALGSHHALCLKQERQARREAEEQATKRPMELLGLQRAREAGAEEDAHASVAKDEARSGTFQRQMILLSLSVEIRTRLHAQREEATALCLPAVPTPSTSRGRDPKVEKLLEVTQGHVVRLEARMFRMGRARSTMGTLSEIGQAVLAYCTRADARVADTGVNSRGAREDSFTTKGGAIRSLRHSFLSRWIQSSLRGLLFTWRSAQREREQGLLHQANREALLAAQEGHQQAEREAKRALEEAEETVQAMAREAAAVVNGFLLHAHGRERDGREGHGGEGAAASGRLEEHASAIRTLSGKLAEEVASRQALEVQLERALRNFRREGGSPVAGDAGERDVHGGREGGRLSRRCGGDRRQGSSRGHLLLILILLESTVRLEREAREGDCCGEPTRDWRPARPPLPPRRHPTPSLAAAA